MYKTEFNKQVQKIIKNPPSILVNKAEHIELRRLQLLLNPSHSAQKRIAYLIDCLYQHSSCQRNF